MSVNHLYTADRTLTRFTKLYCLFEEGKEWRTEGCSEIRYDTVPRRGRAFARLAIMPDSTHSYDAARNTATVGLNILCMDVNIRNNML